LPLVPSPADSTPQSLINRYIHHSSFPEIQQNTTEQTASQTGVAECWPGCKAAANHSADVNVPVSYILHGDEEGIELQEQGHAEMLEHALGVSCCLSNQSGWPAFLAILLVSPECFKRCWSYACILVFHGCIQCVSLSTSS
jgi:hypothetical protein